jgi:hypothetical protein
MTPSTRTAAILLIVTATLAVGGCRTTVVQPVEKVEPAHHDHPDDHRPPPPPPNHHDDRR